MNHYKSWSALNKQLSELLCDELKDRLTYFLTRSHTVHNSYGRAAIRLNGLELVCFSWVEMYQKESDVSAFLESEGYDYGALKQKWDENATYCDADFLSAALSFLRMPIADALSSDDYIIRIFAILDRRCGKRTLQKIKESVAYREYPTWVRQFYELRLETV